MATKTKVSTDLELSRAVEDATGKVKVASIQALETAVDKAAKEITSQTKAKAPRRTGVYAKGWKSKKEQGRVGTYGRVVYQGNKPTLTHLLENGHEIKGPAFYSKRKSRTDPIPHITSADDAEKIFEDALVDEMEKELRKV